MALIPPYVCARKYHVTVYWPYVSAWDIFIYIYIWAIFRYAGSVILSQPISPKSSLQAVHSSVVGTRYGVSFVRIWLIHSLPQSLQHRMDHHDIFCTPTIIAPKCLKDMYTRYLIFIPISYKIVHKQIIIESANCHKKQHTVNDMIHNATCKWCNITSSMSVFIVSRTDMALFQIENTIDFFFQPGPFFCLLLGISSGCAWPITRQVTSVTWPVTGWA